ncbi:MAG: hypothetical protein WCY21_02130 [Candidatus Cloacimonadaceae bacterium]|nr:hypothetical protein [Candidatus Cloacimonadota bacterium]MDX9949175.1 hypothetical protein [Candidatus Syntrophosphaera sp.]
MVRSITFLVLALCGALALFACSTKAWLPRASNDYAIDEGWAIVKTDSLTLFARVKPYSDSSHRISSDYFGIYLKVKNISGRTVSLGREKFILHSSEQALFPLPPQVVASKLRSKNSIDPFADNFFDENPPDWEERERLLQEHYLRLADSHFGFGNILSGGSKEGWIFYDAKAVSQDVIYLELPGGRIEFGWD